MKMSKIVYEVSKFWLLWYGASQKKLKEHRINRTYKLTFLETSSFLLTISLYLNVSVLKRYLASKFIFIIKNIYRRLKFVLLKLFSFQLRRTSLEVIKSWVKYPSWRHDCIWLTDCFLLVPMEVFTTVETSIGTCKYWKLPNNVRFL